MSLKILIIGANGYIGSALIDFFIKKKLDFDCIDNFLYGKTYIEKSKKRIKKLDAKLLDSSYLKKYSHIVLLAALSNNPIDKNDPNQIYEYVYKFSKKIIDICATLKIKVIFPSSCSVYGYSNTKYLVNESSKINPLTNYSKNKAKIEKYLIKKTNVNFKPIILRFGTAYGYSRSIRFDIVINMLMGMGLVYKKITLNSDGLAWRPFTSLNEIVNSIYESINYKNKSYLILNVGFSNNNYKIIDIAKKIAKITNSELSFKNDNSLFRDDLIKNNNDKRSYRVSFSEIGKRFSYFKKQKSNFDYELNMLLKKLKDKGLNKRLFNSINFYRLQKLKKNNHKLNL